MRESADPAASEAERAPTEPSHETALREASPRPTSEPEGGARRTATAGTLMISAARVAFFGCGYVLHVVLARCLEPRLYGVWGLLLSILQFSRVLTSSGPGRAVAVFVAQCPHAAASVRRKGLVTQALLVGPLCLALIPGAPLVAKVLGDATLIPHLRIVGAFMPLLALYGLDLGVLNGMRAFARESALMTSYSVLRMIGIIPFLLLGYKVLGALAGAWLGLFVAVLLGRALTGHLADEGEVEWRPIAALAFRAGLFTIAMAAFQNLDLFLLKALGRSDEEVGLYTVGRLLGQLPYALVFGLNVALLPVVTRSLADRTGAWTRRYVRSALRYTLIALLPAVLVAAATADELVSLIYTMRYAGAASILRLLVFGYLLVSLFSVGATIMIATGSVSLAMTLAFAIVVGSAALNAVLIPVNGPQGAAVATTLAALASAAVAWACLARRFGPPLGALSLFRMVLCAVAIATVARILRLSGPWLIAEYAVMGVVYLGLLLVVREANADDLGLVARLADAVRFRRGVS